MIGFRHQNTNRRPIYSITSQKLGYVESSSSGDVIYDTRGNKIGRITRWKREFNKTQANATLQSSLIVIPEEYT